MNGRDTGDRGYRGGAAQKKEVILKSCSTRGPKRRARASEAIPTPQTLFANGAVERRTWPSGVQGVCKRK